MSGRRPQRRDRRPASAAPPNEDTDTLSELSSTRLNHRQHTSTSSGSVWDSPTRIQPQRPFGESYAQNPRGGGQSRFTSDDSLPRQFLSPVTTSPRLLREARSVYEPWGTPGQLSDRHDARSPQSYMPPRTFASPAPTSPGLAREIRAIHDQWGTPGPLPARNDAISPLSYGPPQTQELGVTRRALGQSQQEPSNLRGQGPTIPTTRHPLSPVEQFLPSQVSDARGQSSSRASYLRAQSSSPPRLPTRYAISPDIRLSPSQALDPRAQSRLPPTVPATRQTHTSSNESVLTQAATDYAAFVYGGRQDDGQILSYGVAPLSVSQEGPQLDDVLRSLLQSCTLPTYEELNGEHACCVCTEDYGSNLARGSELPIKLPCGHIIGQTCMLQWLAKDDTCPICRALMTESSKR